MPKCCTFIVRAVSPSLKTKRHYNTFNPRTGFFLPLADVRASQRLTSSASCLVAGSHGPDRELERLLARQNRGVGTKPILEINLRHPLAAAIPNAGTEAADLSFLLLEQAQILDGEIPEDPAAFASRLNRLVVSGFSKG